MTFAIEINPYKADITILHESCPHCSDSTLSDLQVNKSKHDYIQCWKTQNKMLQIFIRISWRSHKHCKCSFLLTSGPRNLVNFRSCLLLVVSIVTHDRVYLLSVASIKLSVDIMLKYIEVVSKKVFQNTNNRNLFLVEVVTLSQDR